MKRFFHCYFQQLLKILSVTVLCIYSWSILVLLWDMPALLFYLSATDIAGYTAYQFMFALGESLASALFLALIVFLLPINQVKSNPGASGSLLAISFAISSGVFKGLGKISSLFSSIFSISQVISFQIAISIWIYSTFILPILSIILVKNKRISSRMDKFIESSYILMPLYLLLGIAGTIIVLFRNT